MKEKGIPDLTPDYYLKAMEMYRYTYAHLVEEVDTCLSSPEVLIIRHDGYFSGEPKTVFLLIE